MNLCIRQANTSQAHIVSAILIEAAEWLTATNQTLWLGDELQEKTICKDVETGQFHIAYIDDDPAGVFKLQLEDKLFWPDMPSGDSLYLHRIAVKRQYAGKGLPASMIEYAKDMGKQLGRQFLRLDTDATRPKLYQVYERLGFISRSRALFRTQISNGYRPKARYLRKVVFGVHFLRFCATL